MKEEENIAIIKIEKRGDIVEKEISNCIKNMLLEDFHSNNRKGLYSVTQKLMAYNSNKIEGSTLTSEQTASLFDTGTIISNGIEVYRAKDIEEMNGHFKMFNQMLKTINEPLSLSLIKAYHYQLKNGVFEDMANGYPVGEFKNRANAVSDIKTTHPLDVATKMEELLEWFENSEKHLLDIAIFHAEYEQIHPFQDGNGRTGRIILFKQCLDSNFIPVIVKDDDKLLYYRALHLAQTEKDYTQLLDFFEKSKQKYLFHIEDFLPEHIHLHLENCVQEERYERD